MPDITSSSYTQTPPPSHFKPLCHPLVDSVSIGVDEWFLRNWGFANEKARKKFVAAGFSRVTCLYFPKALDGRIRHACELLTILFLIDGKWIRGDLLLAMSCSPFMLTDRKKITSKVCPY